MQKRLKEEIESVDAAIDLCEKAMSNSQRFNKDELQKALSKVILICTYRIKDLRTYVAGNLTL